MTPDEFRNSEWAPALIHNPEGFSPKPVEGYAGSTAPFTFDDVEEVLGHDDGEPDGDSWLVVFRLKDGRFVYAEAGCDYTGWDCRSSVTSWVSHGVDSLLQWAISKENRWRLGYPRETTSHA